jgi:hypothetical protein
MDNPLIDLKNIGGSKGVDGNKNVDGNKSRREEKSAVTLPRVVEKIIKPVIPSESEKAQINIEGADDLYKEIRVENALEDASGEKVKLKAGVQVAVTIEAPVDAVEKKPA